VVVPVVVLEPDAALVALVALVALLVLLVLAVVPAPLAVLAPALVLALVLELNGSK
jgi:hypothetical protein